MYHQVTLAGHVGKSPELRYTPGGAAVTSFTVATSRKWTDKDGEKQEETVWWKVTCWNKTAETVSHYVQVGQKVLVTGEMTPNEYGSPRVWEANDGTYRASYEMRANTVKFLSRTDDSTTSGQSVSGPPDDDSIPF